MNADSIRAHTYYGYIMVTHTLQGQDCGEGVSHWQNLPKTAIFWRVFFFFTFLQNRKQKRMGWSGETGARARTSGGIGGQNPQTTRLIVFFFFFAHT